MNKPVNHISTVSLLKFPSPSFEDCPGNAVFATDLVAENSTRLTKEPPAFDDKVTFKFLFILKFTYSTFIPCGTQLLSFDKGLRSCNHHHNQDLEEPSPCQEISSGCSLS